MKNPTLHFCGGAQTVTGSCTLVRTQSKTFLVDCGLFQGTKTLKELNYEPFPFDPAALDFVLLTHAHIDHSGLLPKLIRDGFSGPIYATPETRDLLSFMLPDTGYIQQIEVRALNRRNQQRGMPTVDPIYTQEIAENTLDQLRPVPFDSWCEIDGDIRVRFWNAGHILGAASIEIVLGQSANREKELRLLFSGDIGPEHKLFHPDPEAPKNLDYVVCESTYGDRKRDILSVKERREGLATIIRQALGNGGVLVIPAFSVERTQELLADINYLMRKKETPEAIVFLDSPLAIRATEVFRKWGGELENIESGVAAFNNENFHFTRSVDESKAINQYSNGAIIISASGMCEAGRIRHHLKRRLWDERSTILFTGYQAPGTMGALLVGGKKVVKIQGDEVRVRARILEFDAYSGHADAEGLAEWMLSRRPVSGGVFLNHGDHDAAVALKGRLVSGGFASDAILIPALDDIYELTKAGAVKLSIDHARVRKEELTAPDWHNDLAQLSIDIRDALEHAGPAERKSILAQLRKTLSDDDDTSS